MTLQKKKTYFDGCFLRPQLHPPPPPPQFFFKDSFFNSYIIIIIYIYFLHKKSHHKSQGHVFGFYGKLTWKYVSFWGNKVNWW